MTLNHFAYAKRKKNIGKENCVNYIIIIMQTGAIYFWENIMGEKSADYN